MSRNYLIGGLMVAGTIALIWASGARAEPGPMAGVNCKTVDGVKDAWDFISKTPDITMGELTAHFDEKKDCVFDHYIGEVKEKADEVTALGERHIISHMQKLAICMAPGLCVGIEPDDRFVSQRANVSAPKASTDPPRASPVTNLCDRRSIETFDVFSQRRVFFCA